MIGFRKPTIPDRDYYVFDVLQILLGQGRTARLHRRIVLKDRTAQFVGAFDGPGSRLNNLFIIAAIPLNKTKVSTLETALWEELNRLKTEKVSEKDLQRIRNRVIVDRARAIESNSGLAETLSYFETVAGDGRCPPADRKQSESI